MNDDEAHEFYADPAHLEIAGPARKHPKDRLTEMLSVRISRAHLNRVTAVAAAEGRPVGSWVRRVLMLALLADERRRREAAQAGEAEVSGGRAVPPGVFPARPTGLIEGSGRMGASRTLPSSLQGRTFSCRHFSVSNVTFAECPYCGPLTAVAV